MLNRGVIIAKTAIVDDDVEIGENTTIGDYAIIRSGTRIGANCKIYPHAVIGEDPQDRAFGGEQTFVEIGDNNIIREFVTIHRATGVNGKTILGNNNYIMVSAHMAHNVQVGNNVTIANNVSLAGYVQVADNVTIGGSSVVHQHCRIGKHVMLSGLSAANKDLMPYFIYCGYPAGSISTNRYGLKKAGFNQALCTELTRAYKIIFNSKISIQTILTKLETELQPFPEVLHLIEFIKSSKRGVENSKFHKIQ